ncbi:MAG: DUF2997 domain-containing protein [Methanomassiliicoccaceae archaeon]|nr:DUF2997 domain-containing protein [Methanomassiliicoccaceae archaeon]
MTEQRITIQINEDGQISAKTSGFRGDICMDALQEILGSDELFAEVKPTDDFYVQIRTSTVNKIQQRGGSR